MNMPKHDVKVGDKFKLVGLIWEVGVVCNGWLNAESESFSADNATFGRLVAHRTIQLSVEDADSIDWLAPEVKKLTQEQAEMILNAVGIGEDPTRSSLLWGRRFKEWLDSFTE